MAHVLPPVHSRHAPFILVVQVRPVHQQVLDDAGLVMVGGIEKAGPTGLQGERAYLSAAGLSTRSRRNNMQ